MDSSLDDARAVRDAGLEGHKMVAATALIAGFRALQHLSRYGIAFESVTPQMLIEFVQDEAAAVRKYGHP